LCSKADYQSSLIAFWFYDSDFFLLYKEVGGKIEPYTIVIKMQYAESMVIGEIGQFFVGRDRAVKYRVGLIHNNKQG
jgi:hypothetical protein